MYFYLQCEFLLIIILIKITNNVKWKIDEKDWQVKYLGSWIDTIEQDLALRKLGIKGKSGLNWKLKRQFFVHVESILLYGSEKMD